MWPFVDFIQYWAAARLNLAGENPYDPAAMFAIEQAAGWAGTRPVMFYGPPWVLPLAYPFALLDWQSARIVGLVVQVAFLLLCAERAGRLYGRHTARDGEAGILATLTFAPLWTALRTGQYSIFQAGGAVALASLTPRSGVAFGAVLALSLIKPQLMVLPVIVLLCWTLHTRASKPLAGMVLAVAVASAAASLHNPVVFSQYVRAMLFDPPAHFVSPTLGSLVRWWLASGNIWWQLLPTAFGAVWAVWYWRRHSAQWEWCTRLPALLFAACLTSGYGPWLFDLVILLPVVVLVARRVRRAPSSRYRTSIGIAYFATQVVLLSLEVPQTPQWSYVWVVPVLLILYLAADERRLNLQPATANDGQRRPTLPPAGGRSVPHLH